MKNKEPEYFYRPNDYSIFYKVKGGYSQKRDIENYVGSVYSLEVLLSHGFISCTEEELPELKRKHDLHYEYVSWSGRSDGHGASKGGTMNEFLRIVKGIDNDIINDDICDSCGTLTTCAQILTITCCKPCLENIINEF